MCIRDRTYFLVSGEIERSNVPVNLLITDASGMSVLTAWAAGKFSSSSIKKLSLIHILREEIEAHHLELAGVLPQDDAVYEADCDGKPSSKIPDASPGKRALHGIMQELSL